MSPVLHDIKYTRFSRSPTNSHSRASQSLTRAAPSLESQASSQTLSAPHLPTHYPTSTTKPPTISIPLHTRRTDVMGSDTAFFKAEIPKLTVGNYQA